METKRAHAARITKTLSPEKLEMMTRNILSVWYSASTLERQQGEIWYDSARQIAHTLAIRHTITLVQAAAVIAVLSPMKSWNQNVKDAERILAGWDTGLTALEQGGTFTNSLKKVDRILFLQNGPRQGKDALAILKGQKIMSFYDNIAHPDTLNITIDGHAYHIAMFGMERLSIPKAPGMTPTVYGHFQQAYHQAAQILNVLPSVLQAVTWVTYRNLTVTDTKAAKKAKKVKGGV